MGDLQLMWKQLMVFVKNMENRVANHQTWGLAVLKWRYLRNQLSKMMGFTYSYSHPEIRKNIIYSRYNLK